jgi:iron complex transport system substrate-binding protein
MEDWVDTTIKVLGKNESNAADIAKIWRKTELELEEKLKDAPVESRPKVLIMFKTKAMLVAGKGTFGHYWIARTGGINAAEELSGKHPAFIKAGNFEDIMKWNPDIIYLSNFEDTMPEDLYDNSIDGQDWSQITAVKERRVYRIPLGIYRWYPPSLDGPLMLKWMARKNYPDLFTYDMEDEIRAYFKEFHHYTLSDSEIEAILEPTSSGNL